MAKRKVLDKILNLPGSWGPRLSYWVKEFEVNTVSRSIFSSEFCAFKNERERKEKEKKKKKMEMVDDAVL